ncbi:SIR2 family protein [Cupriavidus sp. MP-37]|uniref:P-loop NTPase n=1 Tax=Cupriavidus sp. MP-37 TaxID=2884455 RepID=UPI001D0A9B51|nr:SIR2 family protein [Cupriavidus sp. MP-37]UDM50759.1 SIR2 family protein [Cupriavidus sp. MP-37]
MKQEDIEIIKNKICPLLKKGELSLLLGAGFSYRNKSIKAELPSGDELRDELLRECKKTPGPRTTLKDAYLTASRNIPNFNEYLKQYFTVDHVRPWQAKIFEYVWSRIYTTNIDNVLDVAYQSTKTSNRLSGDFSFFNYCDQASIGGVIGSTPVVTIHGTIRDLEAGFIFSNFEYAMAASKLFDWHNELAARILMGGLVVVGNQLDESDIESHISRRLNTYGSIVPEANNWIVMPDPDPIKKENYIASGYNVIDATAEEFFGVLFREVKSKKIDDIVLESIPAVRKRFATAAAMAWFKEAFDPVIGEIERASETRGILRHYVMGAHPEWFYITNKAHAVTSRVTELTKSISARMTAGQSGVEVLHVVGPSGSGKTTAIRSALSELVEKYPYIYEYNSVNGIDIDRFLAILSGFTEKSIFVFYSAAEFYYAVNAVRLGMADKELPFCLFVLEDRINDYKSNLRHLPDCEDVSSTFQFGSLQFDEAKAICERIANHAIVFDKFSNLPLEKQAGRLMDKERGYNGDLLSALYSLTTHENFETKIFEEYQSVEDKEAKRILSVVSTINSLGFSVPINYVAGIVGISVERVSEQLANGLSGILVDFASRGIVACRHRVIADCYFNNCIQGQGDVGEISDVLQYLSNKFTIEDIKFHPLAYQMYKEIVSFNFLYERYFPSRTRTDDTEKTYHQAQKYYGQDGVFWLQFGRFYRKIHRLDDAIECFRTGLEFYESFQTKHSLGHTLLMKYLDEGLEDRSIYDEGLQFLEMERLRRGTTDPYPTTTICESLIQICQKRRDVGAYEKLKECINYGLKHFKEDEYFERQVRRYLKLPAP